MKLSDQIVEGKFQIGGSRNAKLGGAQARARRERQRKELPAKSNPLPKVSCSHERPENESLRPRLKQIALGSEPR